MRIYTSLIILIIIFGSSCRKDFDYGPSSGNLAFSKDTVYLDTVFTNISSSTYSLKVFNTTREDVNIPSIQLKEGINSAYRLNVDGQDGKAFKNIPLFAQDSLYIFIEASVASDALSEKNFLYTDVLQFDTGDAMQEVHLVTLVKDASFIYPKTLADGSKEVITLGTTSSGEEIRVAGTELEDNQLVFTNEKPYVIYGYAKVPSGRELEINAGARVYFHKDSGIYVESGARLLVKGALSEDQDNLENEVIFEGDRLQDEFKTLPGQWGSLWIAPGSTSNTINYLTIKNATIGLRVEGNGILENATLDIKNSQIHNSVSNNLWAKTAFINAQNLVLGSSEKSSLYCNLGGKYSFTHCTIANYWSNGFRLGSALEIDNFNNNLSADLVQADFTNCIIDGNSFLELDLRTNEVNGFIYSFKNCTLKFRDDSNAFKDNPLYDFENSGSYELVLLNQELNFINAATNDFRIGGGSEAMNNGNINAALQIPLDILGNDRTTSPDIGAYEITQGK